jgi:hypothetical protein
MPRGRPRKTDDDDVLLKSAELLGWALGGLEREIAHTRERLSVLTKQATKLRDRLATGGGSRGETAAGGPGGGAGGRRRRRRAMSAEARKRISEMMKKRWAERRKRNA